MARSILELSPTQKEASSRFKLPKAKINGVALNLVTFKDSKQLILRSSTNREAEVWVRLSQRGKNLNLIKGKFKDGLFNLPILKDSLPIGVIMATVFDSNYQPVCERHFYNNREEDLLAIDLNVNDDFYFAREEVNLSLSVSNNSAPKIASVSVMAVDEDYFRNTTDSSSSIVSYFLLESDLKGTIENPGYYFEDETHLKDLDFLMLTQGWTNYKYLPSRCSIKHCSRKRTFSNWTSTRVTETK